MDSSLWWDHKPGDEVDTVDGYPGVVEAVLDGPGPGNEAYQVTLDNGMGGGIYSSSDLRPRRQNQARTAAIASEDYPELADILTRKPPPPTTLSAEAYLEGLLTGADSLYGAVVAMRKQADDGGDHDRSAMVALPIPQDVAQQAAVPGGLDPSEMHVTLAYLPNPTPEQMQAAHQVAATHAGFLGPINASIGGAGQFPAGDDGVPHYAPVDAPGNVLPSLAASIQSALENNDVEVAHDHGFTPHCTRTYLPEGEPAPEPVQPQQFQIPGLVVAQGDDWTHYPFTGMGDPDQAEGDGQDGTAQASKQAGFFSDFIMGRPGPAVNYDWCKFRYNMRCIFPKNLDIHQTLANNQARWTPVLRGPCGRNWNQQAQCPISEPSPNAHQMGVASRQFIEAVSGTSTMAEPHYITSAEARGDSRPVSRDEYRRIAEQGRQMLDAMHRGKAPITGLDSNWDALKQHAWGEVQKPWGGATIDAHTGVPLRSDADKYALTVKPPGMDSVSVHERAPHQEFLHAMDAAKERFRPLLENQRYHLGIFHDDDNHRIDLDPVVVVDSPDEVHKIGAQTHAIGGAFHFKSGNGFWPPHVVDEDKEAARKEADVDQGYGEPDFKGPGHWRSQAEEIQPGYTHRLPEDEEQV